MCVWCCNVLTTSALRYWCVSTTIICSATTITATPIVVLILGVGTFCKGASCGCLLLYDTTFLGLVCDFTCLLLEGKKGSSAVQFLHRFEEEATNG